MSISRVLREIRLTVIAATMTAIQAPAEFKKCKVGNATAGDLSIYTNDDTTQNEYRIVVTGAERKLRALTGFTFRPGEIAFWVKADQAGTVVIEWS